MPTPSALQQNPSLYIFIPFIYVAWSDSELSAREIEAFQNSINEHHWLNESDKQFLNALLDPKLPPSADDLKNWLHDIREVINAADHFTSLVSIGFALAKAKSADAQLSKDLESAKASLEQLEQTLGFISKEATYFFSPEARNTITQKHQTSKTFDIEKLTAVLEGTQNETIRSVKKLLGDAEFKYVSQDDRQAYREKVLAWCKILAKEGYGSMAYPKEFGGQDNMEAYFTTMETLSYHDLSMVVKYGVQFGLFGMSVFFLGTRKHHEKYLQNIGTLALPGCFAMTETGHGSNVRGIKTTATYQHESRSFIIHTPTKQDQKEYIGNAALHGQMATVFAKLIVQGKDYGVGAFLVDIRDKNNAVLPGITIEDCGRKLGLNGVDNGKISFNQVTIPYDNMLDRFAQVDENGNFTSPIASDNRRFFQMLGTLVGGRIGIPRAGLSAAKSGLTIAIRYGDKREQFGPNDNQEVPILNYRTHQRRLIPLLANAYALHFALQHLTQRFLNRTEDQMQEIEALAAGLKAYATWNTTQTLQECRECCGGKGYLSENRLDTLKADTEIFTTFEGDNTVLLQLVAKSRLTEFKQEFSNLNLFSILNYVADQAKTNITEMNPIIIRNTDDAHLLNLEFHLNAFKYRERTILTSAAKRFKRHIQEGMDSFDAFNVVQHHLKDVALAYIHRVVLEQFQLAITKITDDGVKNVLTQLCQLFALALIDEHKGWYLENGYMEGTKTKAIRKMVNQLCWEIRQEAVPLVNAFDIPDYCLAAPIATA
jgi:acyl-CoA oxidase